MNIQTSLPLCRNHLFQCGQMGTAVLMSLYHLPDWLDQSLLVDSIPDDHEVFSDLPLEVVGIMKTFISQMKGACKFAAFVFTDRVSESENELSALVRVNTLALFREPATITRIVQIVAFPVNGKAERDGQV